MSGLTRADIDEIIRLIEGSHFDELRLEMGELKIELRRGGNSANAETSVEALMAPAEPELAGQTEATTTTETSRTTRPAPQDDGSVDVPAPLLGTFYHAPKPGADPFVHVGDTVTPDTVIGIIEVMKLMNSVTADVSGVVTEVVAPNGELVEFGDTLIRVEPG